MVATRDREREGCAAIRHASEARDYLATLVKVHADTVEANLRKRILSIALIGVAAIPYVALLRLAVGAFARGLTGGLTALFGGRAWLGDLVGGAGLLLMLAAGIAAYLTISARLRVDKLRQKYDRIRAEHRAAHGRHISDSTAAPK
jgi:hypothetical protein